MEERENLSGRSARRALRAHERWKIFAVQRTFKRRARDCKRHRGNDTIYGNNGNDYIYGGEDDDTIFGGAGNDYIWGGEGNDKISCGTGNDNVYYEEDFGLDTLLSSSGSVTLNFTDKSITDLSYSISGKTFVAKYDSYNIVNYTTFYNSTKNTYQKAYIIDETGTSYKLGTTKSSGKIKVSATTGNNIFISQSKKNNTITTSTGNDIIYTLGGNDTITYSGGKDYYFSLSGNDYYKVNSFTENAYLSITDSNSDNDKIYINTQNDNIRLFFNVKTDGTSASIEDDYSLYLVNKDIIDYSEILSEETTGFIKINEYFGEGKIETMMSNEDILDIDVSVETLAGEVAQWMIDNVDCSIYETAFDIINNKVDGYEDLIAIYSNAQWNEA